MTGPQSATLTIRGTTLPLPLPLHTTIARVDAGTVRVTIRATVDRTEWGVSGNMAGMMPTAATLVAETVFTKS